MVRLEAKNILIKPNNKNIVMMVKQVEKVRLEAKNILIKPSNTSMIMMVKQVEMVRMMRRRN